MADDVKEKLLFSRSLSVHTHQFSTQLNTSKRVGLRLLKVWARDPAVTESCS